MESGDFKCCRGILRWASESDPAHSMEVFNLEGVFSGKVVEGDLGVRMVL